MKNTTTNFQSRRLISLRIIALLVMCVGLMHSLPAQWSKAGLFGKNIYGIYSNGESMFIATSGDGIYKGSGNDSNWVNANSGLTTTNFLCVTGISSFLYAGADSGVFRSDDSAKTWTAKNTGLPPSSQFVRTIAISGTWIFAGTEGSGLFKSFDNAGTWTQISVSPTVSTIRTIGINNGYFVGTSNAGIYKSTDASTWDSANTNLTDTFVRALAFVGTTLFAGTPSGVFKSTDQGNSWSLVNTGLTSTSVETFAVSGTTLYAGCSYDWLTSTPGGVFKTTDGGGQWTAFNTGMTSNDVRTLFCTSTNLYAGTLGGGLFKATIPVTSVEETNGIIKGFSLEQNYPNPFNPVTTISFRLQSKSFVSLKVFDALGREVASLVDKELSAGDHSRQWNAENMSSGNYFYRLQAGLFTETKKLILLK